MRELALARVDAADEDVEDQVAQLVVVEALALGTTDFGGGARCDQIRDQILAGRVATRFAEGANLLIVPIGDVAQSSSEAYEIAYRWEEKIPAQKWVFGLAGRSSVTLLIPYRGVRPPELEVLESAVTPGDMQIRLRLNARLWRVTVGDTVEINS